jgi:hypothetical protein
MKAATQQNQTASVFRKLNEIGFNTSYVRKHFLPQWWDDEIAETPAGFQEFTGIISKAFQIPSEVLRSSEKLAIKASSVALRYKLPERKTEDDVNIATLLAARLADLAGSAKPQEPFIAEAFTEAAIRNALQLVNFESLADYCWQHGLPVLPLLHLPRGAKKPDALVIKTPNRPVILIAKNVSHSAWALFILAHEIGHIACGHLKENELVEDIKVNWKGSSALEKEADLFALRIIFGDDDVRTEGDARITPEMLAVWAKRTEEQESVDAGALILNYGFTNNNYPLANLALKALDDGSAKPLEILARHVRTKSNDWVLSDQESFMLLSITGADLV